MPRIKTEQLREGMTVVTDVRNIDDMLLIPSGAKLTARQIGILQAWGVLEIDVTSGDGMENSDPVTKLSPEALARATQNARALFWKPDDNNPVFVEIFRLILRRRVKRGEI